jgi:hypothetical protein
MENFSFKEPTNTIENDPKDEELVFTAQYVRPPQRTEKAKSEKPQAEAIGQKVIAKKTPIEVIQNSKNPHLEHAFIKHKEGKGTEELDTIESSPSHVVVDLLKHEFYVDKKYNFIHTHPSKPPLKPKKLGWLRKLSYWIRGIDIKKVEEAHPKLLHSGTDMRMFLFNENMKHSTIAVRDPETGVVLGYNVLSKTKESPTSIVGELKKGNKLKSLWKAFRIRSRTKKYDKILLKNMMKGDKDKVRNNYDNFLEEHNLKSRLVPAKGYKVNDSGISFEKI